MYGLDFQRGESPVTFWWQGFNVGLEICADRGLLYAQGCTNLDLHILVSCGIRRAETGPLKKGGYALVDDGYSRKSSYVKK